MESAIQGGDEYMTSKQMYQQLDIIQSSVPDNVSYLCAWTDWNTECNVNEVSGCQWVNTILLRVSAMVSSQSEGMVFNSGDLTRHIIHTVVLASNTYKRKFFHILYLKVPSTQHRHPPSIPPLPTLRLQLEGMNTQTPPNHRDHPWRRLRSQPDAQVGSLC